MRAVWVSWLVLGAAATSNAACPDFLGAVVTGSPANAALSELSGLVASRRNPGVLWSHNDSGDSARLFALRPDGVHLGTYTLSGAGAVDWEDIAIGPGPVGGVDYLYVADTGNNDLTRNVLTIYRVAEPSVDPEQAPVNVTLSGVDALPVRYPDAPLITFDCETLWSDPATGDIYLVTKDTQANRDGGVSFLFRYPAPQTVGVTADLQLAGSVALGTGLFNLATGGDFAPDGSGLLLRTYNRALYWPRGLGQSVIDAFAAAACNVPLVFEIQGEAIGFSADGQGFYTGSEQAVLTTTQPIRYYAQKDLVVSLGVADTINARVGDTVALRVDASGDAPVEYQWYRGTPAKIGTPIPGATADAYTIIMANVADSGNYYCVASDTDEELTSAVIHVAVAEHLPLGPHAATIAAALVCTVFALRARRRACNSK